MSTKRPTREPNTQGHQDTPEDAWMQTCANCELPSSLAMAGQSHDGAADHRAIPLCRDCAGALLQLQGTPAIMGAMYALCFEMQERTGEGWIYGKADE